MATAAAAAASEGAVSVEHGVGEILTFWLGGSFEDEDKTPSDDVTMAKAPMWFRKDDATDAFIKARFTPLIPLAAQGKLSDWEETPRGALALVILLDQFTRNSFRGSAESFAQDPLARQVANRAIERGFDLQLPPLPRAFFYLPFMHSESMEDQDRCLSLYETLAASVPEGKVRGMLQGNVKYAGLHRDIIAKFGRFPHRNPVVGRESTAEELEHVATHGGF